MDNFHLLDPEIRDPQRHLLLASRTLPRALRDLRGGARYFQPSDKLVAAVNVAIATGAPLLLTGEPGTGKTQVAYYLAWYFSLEHSLFSLAVRSNTTANDLLYRFDPVAYFHAAHDPSRQNQSISKSEFTDKGPLWQAYEEAGPSIVLIDEVDKAPRDFPNDLLTVLDQHYFDVPECNRRVELGPGAPPPIVVITSNSERRLPEAFLRRCIFHHVEMNRQLLERAVASHMGLFPCLDEVTCDVAISRVIELRALSLRKPPATAELLTWLAVLSAQGGVNARELQTCPRAALPALSVLVKDREDIERL